MTPPRPHLPVLASSAAALLLSSCVVKDGSLDFTWWKDAAAPVMEDDVVIESGGGYYHSAPAPERIPSASIPKPEAPEKPEAGSADGSRHLAAQQQPEQDTPAAPPATHTVQKGDTLSAIARRYGTTVRALVAANGMPDANTPLQINQVLALPRTGSTPAPSQTKPAAKPAAQPAPRPAATPGTHTVQPGDTIYRISRQYGIRPTDLMKANGLTPETANTIRAGATLRLPAAK